MRRSNLFAYFLVLGLAACGGGGGGSSSGGSAPAPAGSGGGTTSSGDTTAGGGTTGTGAGGGTITRNPVPDQVALSFTATTAPATVSATTAARLMSNTVTSSRLAQMISSEELALIGTNNVLTGTTPIPAIPCTSGSITISRTAMNSNGTGTLAIDYVDCKKGTDTLNGPATMTIAAYDSASKIITNATLDFTRVRFTGPGLDADISGTQQTEVSTQAASWCNSNGCATERMTQNMIILVREAGNTTRMMRSGLVVTNEYESVLAPTFFTQRLTGSVDDDQLGSVNVTTATAAFTGPWGDLYYSTRFQPFPDWGIVRIDGATGTARASSMGIALAKIEVNADTDAIFENNARLRWIDLATARGSNLNDSDGDGMHDSWEVAMGLDRFSNNDRNGDNDTDGYSNYTEYLVGADASTSGSVPGDVRHLWVTNLSGIAYDTVTNPAQPAFNVFVGGSGDGVQLDTVTRELGTPFTGLAVPAAGGLTVTDTQGRTFTLAPTASPTVWTLSSSTGTSITIDNVGGNSPSSLIRYGDRGIAFRTQGAAPSSSSAAGGYIYLIESRTLIP